MVMNLYMYKCIDVDFFGINNIKNVKIMWYPVEWTYWELGGTRKDYLPAFLSKQLYSQADARMWLKKFKFLKAAMLSYDSVANTSQIEKNIFVT